MKNFLLGLAAAACVAAVLMAQGKINPTDPQPTCNMCPGTLVPLSELEAYTKKALAEGLPGATTITTVTSISSS